MEGWNIKAKRYLDMAYTEPMKLRYVMYLRKSTDTEDRQVQSIEDQQRELERLVAERGLNLVKVLPPESRSAKEPGRPIFNEMLALIESGKADAVLAWKLNRLSRNPLDGAQLQWLLQKKVLKAITTPGREFTPEDHVLISAVEFGQANQFSIDLSEDVLRGMKTKAADGWRPQRAPLGYLNDKAGEQGKKRVFKDPERFGHVRKIWELYLTGNYSVKDIVGIANDEWGFRTQYGRKLSLANGYKLLTNPFYYGEFSFAGEVYQGKHEAMVTREEFDLAQKLLGRAGRPRPKNKRLPFTGVIRCDVCSSAITAEEKIKKIKATGQIKRYIYLRCTRHNQKITCKNPPIKYEELVSQVKDYLGLITLPKGMVEWALGVLRDQHVVEQTDRNEIVRNLQSAYASVVRSIDNLIALYVSPGNEDRSMLSEGEFTSRKNALTQEKAAIQSKIRQAEERVDHWFDLAEKTFNFAATAKTAFDRGGFETKTRILQALGQNFLLKDRKLTLELHPPFFAIERGIKKIQAQKASVELGAATTKPDSQPGEADIQKHFSAWSG
jgi:site-specific DNA recombinase